MKNTLPTFGLTSEILDHIAQGALFLNTEGIITLCNKTAETLLGIPSTQLLERNFTECFSDTLFGFSVTETLSKQISQSAYTIYTTSDNTHNDFEVSATPIPSHGLLILIKDVSEIRHLQAIVNRRNRMRDLGEMAAHVAHEIRNPLGGIKGFASLLKRDLADNPQMQKMANYIVEGTDNLNNLVNQVLHYSRPLQPHLETCDLIEQLNEIRSHLLADASISDRKIKIEIATSMRTLPIAIDIHLFESAILNLIVNAAQAVDTAGIITIKVTKGHRHACISIIDNGIGIPEEHIGKLYSPFFTTKPEGNGLGLPDVQKVVQAHGGTIDVDSTVGKGTTFTIKLPLLHNLKGTHDHR